MYEDKWRYRDLYDGVCFICAHMNVCESICWYMNVNGRKWVYMKVYEALWWYMIAYEHVRMYMRKNDGIWNYMIVYECKW